jgi:uncharacterized protein YndB with AHSA1/START domain
MKQTVPSKKRVAGISSDAVQKRTGKPWDDWFAILDKCGARKMKHLEIAAMLHEKLGCSGWWSQMITVGYEQARGMRQPHQVATGFQIGRTKTIGVPVPTAYRAWYDPKRRGRWLTDAKFTIRKARKNRTLRITWIDGTTNVELYFTGKGRSKSQVTVQHNKLPNAAAGARKKKYWAEQLERLEKYLSD